MRLLLASDFFVILHSIYFYLKMMKRQLIIESDGNDGLIAYVVDTPIVTYGSTLDEVMDNILADVERYNITLPRDEYVEVGDVVLSDIDWAEDAYDD